MGKSLCQLKDPGSSQKDLLTIGCLLRCSSSDDDQSSLLSPTATYQSRATMPSHIWSQPLMTSSPSAINSGGKLHVICMHTWFYSAFGFYVYFNQITLHPTFCHILQ